MVSSLLRMHQVKSYQPVASGNGGDGTTSLVCALSSVPGCLKSHSASFCFDIAGFRVQIFTQLYLQSFCLSSFPKSKPELITVFLEACAAPVLQWLFRLHSQGCEFSSKTTISTNFPRQLLPSAWWVICICLVRTADFLLSRHGFMQLSLTE